VKNRGEVLLRVQIKTPSPIFHWSIYTLNKTSPLKRGRSQRGESKSGANLSSKVGGVASNFDPRLGVKATVYD